MSAYLKQLHEEHKARAIRLGIVPRAKLTLVSNTPPQPKILEKIEDLKLVHTINKTFSLQPYGIVLSDVRLEKIRPTWDDICDFVCQKFGYKVRYVLWAKHRHKRYVRSRWEVWALADSLCPHLSYPKMGQLSGGRDHTTVMHGINQMKQAGQVEKLLDEFWTRSL